jgi:hypothetical protein
MSWKNALNYLRGIGRKQGAVEPTQRKDNNLPFNARIGSLVKLQSSPFLRAQAAGSIVHMPDLMHDVVRAIGHVKLNFPGNIYRFYLEKGDDGIKPERFVQVVVNSAGVVVERMYCERLCRFVPESAEDQEAFTGEAGYGLGAFTYSLGAEQLAQAGVAPGLLAAALNGKPELVFGRAAGQVAQEFVKPFKGTEVRIDDVAGAQGLEQSIWFMPYARELDGLAEHLLITTELVTSKDGDDSRRSIHVDMTLAIKLDESGVSIQ